MIIKYGLQNDQHIIIMVTKKLISIGNNNHKRIIKIKNNDKTELR